MKKNLFILGIALFCSLSQAEDQIKIGRHFLGSPLFKYCSGYEGFMTAKNEDLAVSNAFCNDHHVSLLSKVVAYHGGTPEFVVLDRIDIRPLQKGESFSGSDCYDKNDNYIEWVAIYKRKNGVPTKKNPGIVQAWVVNHATEKFEEAPAKLVKQAHCELESEDG